MLKYPQRPSQRVLIKEGFINDDYFTDNGGVKYNTPTIDNGITLNGTTQYAEVPGIALRNEEEVTVIVEFTPDFDYDEDVRRAFYCTDDAGLAFYSYKNDNAGSNALVARFGETSAINIAGSVYGAFWNVGEKNVLVFTSDGTTNGSDAWLNGTQILTAGGSSWSSSGDVGNLEVGRVPTTGWYFDGTINSVEFRKGTITDGGATDIYEADAFREIDAEKMELFLPLRSHFDDSGNEITSNLGTILNGNITWGSGLGAGEPTLLDKNGADFNSDYIRINDVSTIGVDSVSDVISVGALIKTTEADTVQCVMENDDNWLFLIFNNNTIGFELNDGDGAYHKYSFSDGEVGVGQWTHVAATYDGSDAASGVKIYINGVLQGASLTAWDAGITNNSTRAAVGIRATNFSSSPFIGGIKFPFVIMDTLTPTQIRELSDQAFSNLNV